jgi:hypothetical protein
MKDYAFPIWSSTANTTLATSSRALRSDLSLALRPHAPDLDDEESCQRRRFCLAGPFAVRLRALPREKSIR